MMSVRRSGWPAGSSAAPLDHAGVRRATRAWQPYAGFVYFHLLLDGLAQAGVVRAA